MSDLHQGGSGHDFYYECSLDYGYRPDLEVDKFHKIGIRYVDRCCSDVNEGMYQHGARICQSVYLQISAVSKIYQPLRDNSFIIPSGFMPCSAVCLA